MSRCDHRLTAGRQQVVASGQRGHAICLDWGPKFASLPDGMETCGRDAAVSSSGRTEERDYDVEHLPPLLEDEVRDDST